MKIVIPGGSGQIGNVLARAFVARGDEVVVLSRTPRKAPWRIVPWDGKSLGDWATEVDGADVVINLAGRSVDCRYTQENRREILESRTLSTRVVGESIRIAKRPPRTWLQSSTATIYAHRFDAGNDEVNGILGGSDGEKDAPDMWKFSIEVATAWEQTAIAANVKDTRLVLLRSAMTMSPDAGGVFAVLSRLARLGLGGAVAGGRQFVSWIHDADFIAAVLFLAANERLDGAVNLASPNPLPYSEFMRALRQAWRVPIGLPATAWMLEIATFFLRTESELVLKSRRVVPKRLLDAGFTFRFPDWPTAAIDLVARSAPKRGA